MISVVEAARQSLRRWCAAALLVGALAAFPCMATAADPHSPAPSSGSSTDSPKGGQVVSTGAPDSVAALPSAAGRPAESKAPPDTTRAGAAPAPAPPADQGAPASPARNPEGKSVEPDAKPPAGKSADQAENKAQPDKGSQPEAKPGSTEKPGSSDKPAGTDNPAGSDKPVGADKPAGTDKPADTEAKKPAEKPATPDAQPQGAKATQSEANQAPQKAPEPGQKTPAKSPARAPGTGEAKSSTAHTPPAKASRETRPAKHRAAGTPAATHHSPGTAAKKGATGTGPAAAPAKKRTAPAERGRAADAPPEARHASSSTSTASVAAGLELSEGDRVAREIQRTEVWMRRAGTVVPRSRNPRAMEMLGTADQFQHDARGAYDLKQFARAQRLTQAARDYADRATRMIGPATDDPEYVKSVLEHTDDALDRLKDVLHSADSDRDQEQYDALKDQQKDAWKLLRSGDAHGAYAATVRVRDGVLAVLQRLPEAPVSCDAAEKAIKNAEGARESAVEEIGTKPPLDAARKLQQADGQIAKAHALLDHGDCKEALLRAKAAEQQLERAVDAARPSR